MNAKNKNGVGKNKAFRPHMLEDLGLSAALGFPEMKLVGDREVIITGVRLVKSYAEEEIVLDLDKLCAVISGNSLRLVFLSEGMIKISGRIFGFTLSREKDGGKSTL